MNRVGVRLICYLIGSFFAQAQRGLEGDLASKMP